MDTDKYQNYGELARNEIQDNDYTILYREVDSPIAIIAPHGGGIEPGTVDIADAVAGYEHTFYAFKGLKCSGNAVLHLSSNIFDEPLGVQIAHSAAIVVSIHGCKGDDTILVGGRHDSLKEKIIGGLKNVGFDAVICTIKGLQGINPHNICNRCQSGQGVQLEIPRGLREKLIVNLNHRLLRKKTISFYVFVNALQTVLRGMTFQV